MQGVLDLPGLSDPPRKPWRLYFGLLPDPATASSLAGLTRRLLRDQSGRWIRMNGDRMHLSLHPVAVAHRLRPSILYGATQAARRVAMPSFELCCREAVGFVPLSRDPDRCPLVLRVFDGSAVQELHRRLGAAMARWGLRTAGDFVPHVTLARGPRVLPSRAINPVRFAVRDFVLVWSGDSYDVIERFPLRP